MRQNAMFRTVSIAAATAVLIAGCGGGGGGGASGGAKTTSTITEGRITGFGSVIVNGVHYDVARAAITADGRTITEADLKVGMIVRIKGRNNGDGTGSAQSLVFDDDLEGPVSSVDAANNSFVVLGQTVLVDARTVFDGLTFDALVAGDVVEISGYFDAAGNLRASLVELSDSTEFEVKGRIANLDVDAQTFTLGALTVAYSVAQLKDIDALANGLFVEVKSAQAPRNDGALIADEIEGEDEGVDAAEGDELEIAGLVTAFTSASDFAVNGQRVRVTSRTEFEDGSVEDLAADIYVEVEGKVDADGVLVAEEVSFEQESNVEVEATLDAVDTGAGTITVLGRQFKVIDRTVFKDSSSAADKYLNLSKLRAGQRVEVSAYRANGTLVATKIERENAQQGVSVRGPVDTVQQPNFTIIGITVTTDDNTSFQPEAWFPRVGEMVEVEGDVISDGAILATEVELDD